VHSEIVSIPNTAEGSNIPNRWNMRKSTQSLLSTLSFSVHGDDKHRDEIKTSNASDSFAVFGSCVYIAQAARNEKKAKLINQQKAH
jgi:hypothetical protein